MSKRPRSHQLEDKSIDVLRAKRPGHWVIREKEKDYGIDLEIEVFDANSDEATGYIFYVQVKATDNLKYEKTVRIKLDRLKYLQSFEVPSIIVRYCKASDNLFWLWTSNAISQIENYEAETVSVSFTPNNIWNENSYKEIERTLTLYRTLKTSSSYQKVGLNLDIDGLGASEKFEFKRVVSKIIDSASLFNSETDPRKCLPIDISLKNSKLILSIGVISSISLKIDKISRSELLKQILYSLAFILSRFSFNTQVSKLVKLILEENYEANDREMVVRIALTCMDFSDQAEKLVRLNEIHTMQDFAYQIYISELLRSGSSPERKKNMVSSFYNDAIESYKNSHCSSLAAIHYSRANTLTQIGDFLTAVVHFNFARKIDPEYIHRDYFLRELGSALFHAGRFKLAGKFYSMSNNITPLPQVSICAGDAYLYSGDFSKASDYYLEACSSEESYEHTEANLKCWLNKWADVFITINNITDSKMISDTQFWDQVMEQSFKDKQPEHALGSSLMVGFLLDGFREAWVNALLASIQMDDINYFASVCSCAIQRCGYDAYTPFRDIISKEINDQRFVKTLDYIVEELNENRVLYDDGAVKMRFIGDDNIGVLSISKK